MRFDTFPGVEIPAEIREIGREASEGTRTFPITLTFDAKGAGVDVHPGMAGESNGRVELPEELRQAGVEVPASAILTPDDTASGKSFVWVVDEPSSTVHLREVKPLEITPSGGTLVQGLQATRRQKWLTPVKEGWPSAGPGTA